MVKHKVNLVEEARRKMAGDMSPTKTSWNTVKIGRKNVVVEKMTASPTQGSLLASDIPTTSAYTKAHHKHKCDLCSGWFELSSVSYSVPNYKLLELRRTWGVNQTGRRYDTASFLYANAKVCKFCSQFFDQSYEAQKREIVVDVESPSKAIISTTLERSNIALNKFAYQCSSMDNMAAEFALEPPYLKASRTRREIDPWWEVDLGGSYHINKICFETASASGQILGVSAMIFDNCVGYEDPFLDSAKGKAKQTRDFMLDGQGLTSQTFHPFEWSLGGQIFGRVIRIQLKGFYTLQIKNVKIFQGDVVAPQEDSIDINTLDEDAYLPGAFARLSPGQINQTLMFSPMRPRETLKDIQRKRDGGSPKIDVNYLLEVADDKKKKFNIWLKAAKRSAKWFSKEELLAIREYIFDEICVEKKSTTFVTSKNRPNSRGDTEKEIRFSYQQLMGSCLASFEPRADLAEVHQKLRQIMLQIDLKSNLKKLGAIGTSKKFEYIAEDDEEQLRLLQMAFDFMQDSWDIIDAQKVTDAKRRKAAECKGVLNSEPDVFPIERGCTWAQLCVILHLWCSKRSRLIPAKAFLETNFRGLDFFEPKNTHYDQVDDQKKHTFHGSVDLSDPDVSLDDTLNMSLVDMRNDMNDNDSRVSMGSRSRTAPGNMRFKEGYSTLLQTVRSQSTLPVLDTQFSEYKLNNLSKKVALYPTFPKKLRPDFVKFWVKPKAAVVEEAKDDSDDDKETQEPLVDMQQLKEITTPFKDNRLNLSDVKLEGKKKGFFVRICSLCLRKYPKRSIRTSVLLKHVITLRKSWDKSLIPDKMELLEDGMGMYNLVPVCAYCAQFFDPDWAGGIAYPMKQVVEEGKIGDEHKKKKPIFYDTRFPMEGGIDQAFFSRDERALKSRAGARTVMEVTATLTRRLEEEEELRKAKEEKETEKNA